MSWWQLPIPLPACSINPQQFLISNGRTEYRLGATMPRNLVLILHDYASKIKKRATHTWLTSTIAGDYTTLRWPALLSHGGGGCSCGEMNNSS